MRTSTGRAASNNGVHMGWFSGSSTHECRNLGKFGVEVVGEQNYQQAIAACVGAPNARGYAHTLDVTLVLEDNNKFDDKAVMVTAQNRLIGYLSREDARKHRRKLTSLGKAAATVVCRAIVTGGWDRGGSDKGPYGVKLDLYY